MADSSSSAVVDSRKRKKQLPTSYYDPAFTDPYYYYSIGAQQQQHQPNPVAYGDNRGGRSDHHPDGGSTGQGSNSGDIIFPKIDVNSIFF